MPFLSHVTISRGIYKEEVHIFITSMNDKRRIEKEEKGREYSTRAKYGVESVNC